MEIITSIKIRNFRSIKSMKNVLKPTHLNIFVGQNDQGKSNVLRALNLFFNNQTDAGLSFRFDDNYCFHAATGTGTRKEIWIELIINPPKHRFKHAQPVRWLKKWRRDGSVVEEKHDLKTRMPISARNNVSKWLDKLRFRYVPAIKGQDYFTQLMGELHDVLNEAHAQILKDQGEDFIDGIKAVTSQITEDLEDQIGISSTIQVPSDFRLLFSNLDFGSNIDGNIYHLKQRGDGIKVRHIPIVLKYMSEQEKNISIPGYVKPDTIWGFEEPENNLELRYAFELAETKKRYAKDIQIFLTTHSPAFYSLDKDDTDGVNAYYVERDDIGCTMIRQITHADNDSIHDQMGLLPIISPYLEKIYKSQQKVDELATRLDEIGANTECVILTEDANQTRVREFFAINEFKMETTEIFSYAGADQLNAAILLAKYIATKNPDAHIVIHRDRDYLTDSEIEKLRKSVEQHEFYFFVTQGVDIESHYLCPDHICELYPDIEHEDAINLINEATNQVQDDSLSRLYDRHLKKRPNNGAYGREIAEIQSRYEANKPRYRYGKKVCGTLTALLQQRTGNNVNLYQQSGFLVYEQLNSIANTIWEEI